MPKDWPDKILQGRLADLGGLWDVSRAWVGFQKKVDTWMGVGGLKPRKSPPPGVLETNEPTNPPTGHWGRGGGSRWR